MNRAWLKDTAERAGSSFGEAFCAALLAALVANKTLDLGAAKSVVVGAIIAGLTSGLAVLKAAFATLIGDPSSASLLPSVAAVPEVDQATVPFAAPLPALIPADRTSAAEPDDSHAAYLADLGERADRARQARDGRGRFTTQGDSTTP